MGVAQRVVCTRPLGVFSDQASKLVDIAAFDRLGDLGLDSILGCSVHVLCPRRSAYFDLRAKSDCDVEKSTLRVKAALLPSCRGLIG
jgi:hypothetical protein